ncbi:MAG: NAD(P)-binding protein [Gammaproteobacteria bacterium]|nr:NAD(P)-binding protein [Gammaproteobacteria bacterium]
MSHYSLVIIGAGAAGLGASELASQRGLDHVVLEASHRTGGRGLTEMLSGKYPVDLGCHWMHSATVNPYVQWADKLGYSYETGESVATPKTSLQIGNEVSETHTNDVTLFEEKPSMFFNGQWLTEADEREYAGFLSEFEGRVENAGKTARDCSLWDVMEQKSRWSHYQAYWLSLLHSNDPDQVSVSDRLDYFETHEDYPLQDGYGALISEQGKQCPVELNTVVKNIDWSGSLIRVETNKGQITANKIILTVSTGVLGSNEITFVPALPVNKLEAIHALPMGNYNNLFFCLDDIDSDVPPFIQYSNGETSGLMMMQPFGHPYVVTFVAGRFAWWFEKQGAKAEEQYFREQLIDVFGSNFGKKTRQFKSSAWGYDPWVKGAYSSVTPGHGDARRVLAETVGEKLYFAGEATSQDALNTAHGAYLSGKCAVSEAFG